MQTIFLDTYQLHSNTGSLLNNHIDVNIEGLDLPQIRQDAYNRPGEDGGRLAHSFYAGRTIVMRGEVYANDVTTYRAARQALGAAFGLQRDNNNVPILRSLQLKDLVGNQYQINVSTKTFLMRDEYPLHASFQIEFYAPDYRILSQTSQTVSVSMPVSGGVVYTVVFPIVYGASSGGSAVAVNNGSTQASPIVTIAGPAINPVVTNQTTGERFAINLTLLAGDVLTLDMANRTLVQGTSSSTTPRMGSKSADSVFWKLQPGSNLILFTADTFDTGTATVSWQDSYLVL